MSDTSRDPALLEPQLRKVWELASDEYTRRFEDQVFLTCTYRGPVDQAAAFHAGRSRAQFGESLHNFRPAYAFDVAFLRVDGSVDWSPAPFARFAEITKRYGLEWGGDWPGLIDGPHHQLPMTVADARAGRVPRLPALTPGGLLVVQDALGVNHQFDVPVGADVLMRVSRERDRVYVTIK